jgi:hypothetical protein
MAAAAASESRPSPSALILQRQNADGGWPYSHGGSWLEPTVLAMLALQSSAPDVSGTALKRAAAWVASRQHSDGGFAPSASVSETTWVTALPLLLTGTPVAAYNVSAAVGWLVQSAGRRSSATERLRARLLGQSASEESFDGWPWLLQTNGWVYPTALSLAALTRASRFQVDNGVAGRIRSGREFLEHRVCKDGGWDYGTPEFDRRGSYPDATGAALFGLSGATGATITRAISAAESHAASCRSSEAFSWLQLGLAVHGRALRRPAGIRDRNLKELALSTLATAVSSGGYQLL